MFGNTLTLLLTAKERGWDTVMGLSLPLSGIGHKLNPQGNQAYKVVRVHLGGIVGMLPTNTDPRVQLERR